MEPHCGALLPCTSMQFLHIIFLLWETDFVFWPKTQVKWEMTAVVSPETRGYIPFIEAKVGKVIKSRDGRVLWRGTEVPSHDELLKLTNGVISDFWVLDQCYVHYLGDRWEYHLGPGLMPDGPNCGGCDIG